MITEKTEGPQDAPAEGHHVHVGEVVADAIAGAAAGAAAGVLGGPAGMAVGALLGGAIGAAAGEAVQMNRVEHEAKDEQLDRDIGVIDGGLGEASPNQPPSVLGRFHGASLGIGAGSGAEPSEGIIQDIDKD